MTAINLDLVRLQLRAGFCGSIDIRPVSIGYAVSAGFKDSSGDPISFYVVPEDGLIRIEDDGSYLSDLVARDIPIDQGQRSNLLQAILHQGSAYWDRDTFEIRTENFEPAQLGARVVDFVSALVRVRDLEVLTREAVRSTFREDAVARIHAWFDPIAIVEEDTPPSPELAEFPSDIVIRPRPNVAGVPEVVGAVYIINSNDKLNEALLAQTEAVHVNLGFGAPAVIGLIETADMVGISRKRFQRAQNRSLTMPIFRGDEVGAMGAIARRLGWIQLTSVNYYSRLDPS